MANRYYIQWQKHTLENILSNTVITKLKSKQLVHNNNFAITQIVLGNSKLITTATSDSQYNNESATSKKTRNHEKSYPRKT